MKPENHKNEVFSSTGNIIKSKIDIKAGDMTFFQRIELGKIFNTKDDILVKYIKSIELLHGFRPDYNQLLIIQDYLNNIIDGLIHWSFVEEKMLKYEPTPEEKKAGIIELSRKIGEMGTVISMAEKFSLDPDEILKWKYSKVFGLLYADLEKSKFNRKYNSVISKERK